MPVSSNNLPSGAPRRERGTGSRRSSPPMRRMPPSALSSASAPVSVNSDVDDLDFDLPDLGGPNYDSRHSSPSSPSSPSRVSDNGLRVNHTSVAGSTAAGLRQHMRSSMSAPSSSVADDDPFEPIPVAEQFDAEDEEDLILPSSLGTYTGDSQSVNTAQPQQSRGMRKADDSRKNTKTKRKKSSGQSAGSPDVVDNRKPARGSDDADIDTRKDFVDRKKGKILPFGTGRGGKRPKKVKEHDLDSRKNLRVRATIIHYLIVFTFVALLVFAAYKVFWPQATLSKDDVQQIAASTVGMTNFPSTRGEAFAKDFMQAYLTSGDESATKALGYFYSGTMEGEGSPDSLQVSSGYKQKVLFGPTVYSAKSASDTVGVYTVGALVQASAGDGSTPQPDASGKTGTEPTWQFYNVSVYYDAKTDRMYITPESPAVVPVSSVGNSKDTPTARQLGTGESDSSLKSETKSTVLGFMSAYAEATPQNHSALDQYVVNGAKNSLKTGLGGEFTFNGGVDNAVEYEVYPTDNKNIVKVKVVVSWRRAIGTSGNTLNQTSTYVLTLDNSSGKWLATKFAPFLYEPDPNEIAAAQADTSTSEQK